MTDVQLVEAYIEVLTVPSVTPVALVESYLEVLWNDVVPPPPPTGPTAQIAFTWGGVKYAKGDAIPAFRESQMQHMRRRGYVNTADVLVVGKPFKHGGTAYARGGVMPVGLTDAQLRRLIASRHLV